MSPETLLATRTERIQHNAIREILKVVARPGMISLAGGIPAPESFPMNLMSELVESVIAAHGPGAFQYDLTEGFGPLREALSGHLGRVGIAASASEILVSSGSQGVLDALGKILVSPGDVVAVEAPTYLGALSAFNPYEPRYVRLETDEEGVIPESLEEVLRAEPVKFVYLVPTFQNPSGRTIPAERRRRVAELLVQYDALLVEDDPYGALRYDGESPAPIQTLAPDHVVYIGTLSKIFAPGLRVGFCVAPATIRGWLVRVKQGVDLHTSTFNQALAAEYLSGGHLERHLPVILDLYKPRRDALLAALERYFPEECRWSRPQGGMFVWVTVPEGMDMRERYGAAVERGVAYVPGEFFFATPGEGKNTMRLNFTMNQPAELDRATALLAELVTA